MGDIGQRYRSWLRKRGSDFQGRLCPVVRSWELAVFFCSKGDKMNKIKAYLVRQTSRPAMDLATDFFIVGALFVCIYFGWIH